MRTSVKTDKRDFVEGLGEEAERAAASRNMKKLYDTTKTLAGKFKKSERPIRDLKKWDCPERSRQAAQQMGRSF